MKKAFKNRPEKEDWDNTVTSFHVFLEKGDWFLSAIKAKGKRSILIIEKIIFEKLSFRLENTERDI